MTDKPSLTQVAEKLRTEAQAQPGQPARIALSGGLSLVLLFRADALPPRWQLSLVRADGEPSKKEIEICRRDFDVPAAARVERVHSEAFQIVRLKWAAAVQMSFFEEDDRMVAALVNNYEAD